MPPSETFIDIYVNNFTRQREDGVHQWTLFVRRDPQLAQAEIEAAQEAARRLGITVYADYVPDDYEDATVSHTPGTRVIRIADTPAPWNRRRRWWQRRR